MVGGTVIETRAMRVHAGDYPGRDIDVHRLWCANHHGDECAVYTKHAEGVRPGDSIWWQDGKVYWTSADRRFIDKPLPKVGYSFDPRSQEGK